MPVRPDVAPFARGPSEHRLERVSIGGQPALLHAPSGLRFLERAHGFHAGQAYRYDERGRNVSVRYSVGVWAVVTLYVFPFEPPRTPETLAVVFEESRDDMLAALPGGWALCDRRTAFGHAAGGMVPGRRFELMGPAEEGSSQATLSILEMFALRTWLLKMRATCLPPSVTQIDAFVDAWLAAALPDKR
jgi:hypothetical protein